ncbi:MAG TPA: dienelactone hydrolase family protein, partial [Bdellovibrio sp.]|nr:dienelactone hydrolase family protein [Bdellovibrio sp.]
MTAAKITHQNVTVNTKDGPMNIYIALPPQPASQSPALIILQEAFGVNHHIKDVCHRFAKEGYIAVAPELFHRSGQNLELPYGDFSKVLPILGQLTNDKLLEDMTATFNYLKGLSQVSSIGTIGYCMGGFCAVLA